MCPSGYENKGHLDWWSPILIKMTEKPLGHLNQSVQYKKKPTQKGETVDLTSEHCPNIYLTIEVNSCDVEIKQNKDSNWWISIKIKTEQTLSHLNQSVK